MKTWRVISLVLLGVFLLVENSKAQFDESIFMRYSYCYIGNAEIDIDDYQFVSYESITLEITPDAVIVYLPDGSTAFPVVSSEYDYRQEILEVTALTNTRDRITFIVHNKYTAVVISREMIILYTTGRL